MRRPDSLFNRFYLALVLGFCSIMTSIFADAVHARGPDGNASSSVTWVAVRHVNFRIDPRVQFHIVRIRGELVPLAHRPVIFDDKGSFGIAIESGTIALSTKSMAALLNDYVFAYPGTPIRDVKLTSHDGRLVESAAVHRIPATMAGKLGVTSGGLIKFTPDSIKMAGVPVKTLMDAFGAHSQKMAHPDESRGFKIVGDDQLLNINQFPTSPRLYGHVVDVRLDGDNLVMTFAPYPASEKSPLALEPPLSRLAFIYFRGGTVGFGKLKMRDTEMEIVSARQQDWLDFDLDHYNDQLTAGCTETTASFALVVSVPNYEQVNEN
jgi:hypothetical protein